MGCAEASITELFASNARVDGDVDVQGRLVSSREDAVPYDQYQYSKLMRSRRNLRLKKDAT